MLEKHIQNKRFWRGKKCLITGAEGFVAVHLAQKLIQAGALVYGTLRNRVRLISRLDLFDLRSKMSLFFCDLRDYQGLVDLIAGEHINTVFHVAARALVNTAARTPLTTFESNIMGTINVLEACRQTEDVERIVVTSSDKAYGDHRSHLPYTESHGLQGLHVYDCSKSCADLIAQTYYFQFHLPVRVTRCCNIYGPGDLSFSRLVPGTIFRSFKDRPSVIRQGQANVKREYLFVTDATDAYLAIAQSITNTYEQDIPDSGELTYSQCAYNIGSGEANVQTTKEMIMRIQGLMGKQLPIKELARRWQKYVELPDQYLDSTKMTKETGWKANTDMNTGLMETIKWYKKHLKVLTPLYESEELEQ